MCWPGSQARMWNMVQRCGLLRKFTPAASRKNRNWLELEECASLIYRERHRERSHWRRATAILSARGAWIGDGDWHRSGTRDRARGNHGGELGSAHECCSFLSPVEIDYGIRAKAGAIHFESKSRTARICVVGNELGHDRRRGRCRRRYRM